ncbi:hypothetical protein [Streptomyces sp. NPDC018321]
MVETGLRERKRQRPIQVLSHTPGDRGAGGRGLHRLYVVHARPLPF